MTHLRKCVSFSLILISLMGFVMVPMVMGAVAPKITGLAPASIRNGESTDLTISGTGLRDAQILINDRIADSTIKARADSKIVIEASAISALRIGKHPIVAIGKGGVPSVAVEFKKFGAPYVQAVELITGDIKRLGHPDWEDVTIRQNSIDNVAMKADLSIFDRGIEKKVVADIGGSTGTKISVQNGELLLRLEKATRSAGDLAPKYGWTIACEASLPPAEKTRQRIESFYGSGDFVLDDGADLISDANSYFPKRFVVSGVRKELLDTTFLLDDLLEVNYQPGQICKDAEEEYICQVISTEWSYVDGFGRTRGHAEFTKKGADTTGLGEKLLRKNLDIVLVDAQGVHEAALMVRGLDRGKGEVLLETLKIETGDRRRELLKIADEASKIVFGDKELKVKAIHPDIDAAMVKIGYTPRVIGFNPGKTILHEEDRIKFDPQIDEYLRVRIDFTRQALELGLISDQGIVRKRAFIPLNGAYVFAEYGYIVEVNRIDHFEAECDFFKFGPNGVAPFTARGQESPRFGISDAAEKFRRMTEICMAYPEMVIEAGKNHVITSRDIRGIVDGEPPFNLDAPEEWSFDVISDNPEIVKGIVKRDKDVEVQFREKRSGQTELRIILLKNDGRVFETKQRITVDFTAEDHIDAARLPKIMGVGKEETLDVSLLDRLGARKTSDPMISALNPDILGVDTVAKKIQGVAEGSGVLAITDLTTGKRFEHTVTVVPHERQDIVLFEGEEAAISGMPQEYGLRVALAQLAGDVPQKAQIRLTTGPSWGTVMDKAIGLGERHRAILIRDAGRGHEITVELLEARRYVETGRANAIIRISSQLLTREEIGDVQ